MKAIFLGILLMVFSPLYIGCSFLGVSQRVTVYKRYVGLGDSISIDEYAGGSGWGAISLFYRNKDDIYPEWKGKDLRSIYPGIDLHYLASDGATCSTVLGEQLPALPPGDEDPTIITLTVGGNDFLSCLGPGGGIDTGAIDDFRLSLTKILETLYERYPNCLIILGTIYDPTDGVGDLAIPDVDVQEAYTLFRDFNKAIRDIGESYGAHIADIYSHFLGHGSHHGDPNNPHYCPDDPSYWYVQEIEPNARGAHEVRRKFWETLKAGFRG
jgi:lysophospholipase L1-like esterase